ncbi:hypothetical protein [Rhodobacter calidifons]|uniref:SatD family protein n=1 Tax=Rhodobacter calidifons TaxID=2715277 RepID=A0ABX0G929_9RHOB|nr:hypothetical protein [Rhodobacter calidifons]NHB77373.1 hypothetical protein [Rhodobacter calidifons]
MRQTLAAVITGDLVASSNRPVGLIDAAMRAIREAAITIADWHRTPTDTRFTRFRGDGWQIVLAEPRLALRAAVVIQARLIALGMESRISIGVGTVDSLGTTDLSDAAGEAFALSGRGLDGLGGSWRFALNKTESAESDRIILVEDQLIADLLAERISKWTVAQAEAAALHLSSPARVRTLFEIGQVLNISPQAVNDRLRGAGTATIASVLRRWEGLKQGSAWDGERD